MIGSQLEKAVIQACVIVENDFRADLSVATVARQVGVSRYAFQRAFRSLIGESFAQHVRRLRVERAAFYLRSSDCEVQELAERSGFWTTTGFIRAFSRQFGMTPRAFRESCARVAPRSDRESAEGIGEHHRSLSVCLTEGLEFRVAFLRCRSDMSDIIATWERLLGLAESAGLLTSPVRFLGLHHDGWETAADQARYDAAIVVPSDTDVPAPMATRVIPAGLTAQIVSSSRREQHERDWRSFYEGWLPESGCVERLSFVWEEYQTDLRDQSTWNQVRQAVQALSSAVDVADQSDSPGNQRSQSASSRSGKRRRAIAAASLLSLVLTLGRVSAGPLHYFVWSLNSRRHLPDQACWLNEYLAQVFRPRRCLSRRPDTTKTVSVAAVALEFSGGHLLCIPECRQ